MRTIRTTGWMISTVLCFLAILWSLARMLKRDGFAWKDSIKRKRRTVGIERRLAVVVPVHEGDSSRAMEAISKWPSTCHRQTVENVDLIIYEAEGRHAERGPLLVPPEASACFRATRIIQGNLLPEENVYPKGASVQFYKLFLDDDVAGSVAEYDALAIIEWDVIVAHPESFVRLYDAAFCTTEPFWVKGSTLAGTEFHGTANVADMWHVLGHLNGNAIYNNSDPAFVEFVNYTLMRWNYDYSYDVALWATIADFPYSWPLWQRFSSKFVATELIVNVGFHDVDDMQVGLALSKETLFIHGSARSGGSVAHSAIKAMDPAVETPVPDCTSSCASPQSAVGLSSFCDESCVAGWSLFSAGPRFRGHGCGAGDVSVYGRSCRTCYTNQQDALQADRDLETSRLTSVSSAAHVVMCATGLPPPALDCSAECQESVNTICDYRCGSGKYGDFHCNWRGLGERCRFCFDDTAAAYLADGFAKARDSRVIMCATHEPPEVSGPIFEAFSPNQTVTSSGDATLVRMNSSVEGNLEEPREDSHTTIDPSKTVHSGDVLRGEMCAFVRGYYEFLRETEVAVSSILQFMPGMRVGIATLPRDYHVFNRTLGRLPDVSIANSSKVEYAALHADDVCGQGTRLIYFMSAGDVLSRTFTSKDTHTPRGDLVVHFTDVDLVDPESARRAIAGAAVLGFASPSFTYGSDLILPAAVNGQLRRRLHYDQQSRTNVHDGKAAEGEKVDNTLEAYLDSLAEQHLGHGSSFDICQVLAALAYSRNPDGVVFVSPAQWSKQNLFFSTSIWEIPLVKPPFSCAFDISWAEKGYDMGRHLGEQLQSFIRGAKCELGFKETHPRDLLIKPNREFGVEGALRAMPDLRDYNISVMYRTFVGDADLFNLSVTTVMDHFASATELVAVVLEADVALFERIVGPFRATAPFPLRVVGEPDLMDGHIQQKYSKLRADLYTTGDFILHLDSDVVLFEDISYDEMFHLGKAVLPFRRDRSEAPEGEEGMSTIMCWQKGTSFAIGEDVVHEFSIFNTHVYPRQMYSAARHFIEEHHGMNFVEFMSSRRGSCMGTKTMATWTLAERTLLFSDFNFMGAFLWYHMHDAVYWLPADPFDTQPDEWRPDLLKYAWVCQANGRHTPDDAAGLEQYLADYRLVSNVKQCHIVKQHWKERRMRDPQTRTPIDTNCDEWQG
ncbi:unnamed protein product [Scytosiphon promiscuus]